MAKTINTRSDVLESAYEAGLTTVIRASIALLVSLFALYLGSQILKQPWLMILAGFAVAGSLVWGITGAWAMQKAREAPTITVHCPYCEHPMQFVATPKENYTCEGCHRVVYYEDGKPVPVREITCTICKTVHKVSVKATTFTCDRCNRTLRLADPESPQGIVAEQGSDVLRNYDVILTQIGRQPNDVAIALESILICNLAEARRQMTSLPLTVMRNVPERKADAVRRRLRDLGATAVIRPTADEQTRAGRPA